MRPEKMNAKTCENCIQEEKGKTGENPAAAYVFMRGKIINILKAHFAKGRQR